jgi:filamentous hemagglutinin
VGIGAGSGGWGINVSASINKGSGHENSDCLVHNETQVTAGNRVTLVSGRDTTLTGAQVSGESIKADVGRNLTLTSEQDSATYDAQQKNTSAGASFNFGSMSGSASINMSKDKMHSDYQSVQEQSGLLAGKGGFDITVGEHTQLNGAVISSTADASLNRLETGTLGWSDIKNEAEYKVQHQSVGISTGGSIGNQFAGNMANGLLTGVNGSGSDSSTTHSAISEGSIIVRDQDKQQQDVASLSRDVENANPGLGQIFDKEKEQNRLKEAQLIGQIGSQVGDIARTQGQIEATKAGKAELAAKGVKEPGENATKEERAAWNKALTETSGYKTAQQKWGTGSAIQQGIQAATAAVQGLAGGNIAQAVSGAAAPYLAEQIHVLTEGNPEAKAMAHAVVGAVASYASGHSALAGAAGAVSGELMAGLVMQQLYPGKAVGDLTETEKQTVSALGTLAAGLAGGVVGDGAGNAVTGAQAGKNSSENNNLSLPGGLMGYGQAASTLGTSMIDAGATTEEINAALSKNTKGDLPEGANITKAIVEGYKDGVLIAGAAYLGPAASIGKVVTGGMIAEIANGTYQWFDINSEKNRSLPENQQKTWDYWNSGNAALTGMLAPGRGIWQNVGIAAAGSVFTDGANAGAVGGAVAGGLIGGGVGKYAPDLLSPVFGSSAGFWSDVGSAYVSEATGSAIKDAINKQEDNK